MATRVHESAIIKAPINQVWEKIRAADFKFWGLIASASKSGADGQVGGEVTLNFKDSTVQVVKIVELSDLEHKITYDVISSEPAINVLSAIHTIQLRRVTVDNTTFIEWFSDFSSDATQEVIQDSRYKKLEAFNDLAKAF